MKKLISMLLVAEFCFSLTTSCFALKAEPASNCKGFMSVNLQKPHGTFCFSPNMDTVVLGVVEVALKDGPQDLPNCKYEIYMKKEPEKYHFNPFDWSTFLRKKPVRPNVNNPIIEGPYPKFKFYQIFSKLWNWIFGEKPVPIEYSLVPLSYDQAKKLLKQPVKPGQMKPDVQSNKNFTKTIEDVNGKSDYSKLREALIKRAFAGLNDQRVDPYDPYNTVQQGTITQYVNNPENVDHSQYYTATEALLANKKAKQDRDKVCDDLANISAEDLLEWDKLGILDSDSPYLHFAVVCNNVHSAEAYKLIKLIESSGANFLQRNGSVFEISASKKLNIPKDGLPSDQRLIDEVNRQVEAIKDKPTFKQWCKNGGRSVLNYLKKILPQICYDGLSSFLDMAYSLFNKSAASNSKKTKSEGDSSTKESSLGRVKGFLGNAWGIVKSKFSRPVKFYSTSVDQDIGSSSGSSSESSEAQDTISPIIDESQQIVRPAWQIQQVGEFEVVQEEPQPAEQIPQQQLAENASPPSEDVAANTQPPPNELEIQEVGAFEAVQQGLQPEGQIHQQQSDLNASSPSAQSAVIDENPQQQNRFKIQQMNPVVVEQQQPQPQPGGGVSRKDEEVQDEVVGDNAYKEEPQKVFDRHVSQFDGLSDGDDSDDE